jgi:hypothetical protein
MENTVTALFNAVMYGGALMPTQLDTVLTGIRSLQP